MGRPKADQEVEQLWTYLREIDQQLLPFGLLQSGEYELRPETGPRPIVFRTFLDGAGLQAVAVGGPSGRHAAFDALDVRWALTWRGRFLDALTTWEERAMTPARPLGDAVTTLPAWMPFARTPHPPTPGAEVTGAAAGYRYCAIQPRGRMAFPPSTTRSGPCGSRTPCAPMPAPEATVGRW